MQVKIFGMTWAQYVALHKMIPDFVRAARDDDYDTWCLLWERRNMIKDGTLKV